MTTDDRAELADEVAKAVRECNSKVLEAVLSGNASGCAEWANALDSCASAYATLTDNPDD
jgi:hypothetical protein